MLNKRRPPPSAPGLRRAQHSTKLMVVDETRTEREKCLEPLPGV